MMRQLRRSGALPSVVIGVDPGLLLCGPLAKAEDGFNRDGRDIGLTEAAGPAATAFCEESRAAAQTVN
jgi:hypothetical protein